LKCSFIAGLSDLECTTNPPSVKNPLCLEIDSLSLSLELDDAVDDDEDELSFVPSEHTPKPSLYPSINVLV
jgi:hypothetical protein